MRVQQKRYIKINENKQQPYKNKTLNNNNKIQYNKIITFPSFL